MSGTPEQFNTTKLRSCVRLARECRRLSWQQATALRAIEYRRISREAMQDARKYAQQLQWIRDNT
jgi:hypothetical protein